MDQLQASYYQWNDPDLLLLHTPKIQTNKRGRSDKVTIPPFRKKEKTNPTTSFCCQDDRTMIQRCRRLLSPVLGSILLLMFSTTPSFYSSISAVALAEETTTVYDGDEDDDILTEMMADEKRENEELAQLQAEMQELEALKAQRQQQSSTTNSGPKIKPSSGMGGMSDLPGAKPGQFDKLEEDLRQKEARVREARQATDVQDKVEADRQKLDEAAAAREAAYRAELERVKDDETKRKALKRQKANDAAVVRRVLHRSAKGMHYAVLGFNPLCRWWPDIQVGPVTLCAVSASKIKRAFRTVARRVHPDKNRDGRAEEAFRLLEESAALLGDVGRRKEYDMKLRLRRGELLEGILGAIGGVWRGLGETVGWAKRVLGPLFLPVVTLLLIII